MPPMPLPIDAHLNKIHELIAKYPNLVITATPGAGKTTRVPPHVLEAVEGKVIVLQPRRMAAVAACHRVCEERGWTVGREAGYRVRFESKVERSTRLIFMTDALFVRLILEQPELSEVGLVILDEFHERNIHQDLALGYVREMQELGRDIRLMVMSATLDAAKVSGFLGGAPVVEVAGIVYPLTVQHQIEPLLLHSGRDFVERVVRAVGESLNLVEGDVLVFLPGVGELHRVQEHLQVPAGIQVMILHGSLPLAEQQAVLRAGERRRVILATNVAEASVTVDGVNAVVDSGVAKVMECNIKTGFSELSLQRISLFNATQRAGRAARQRAGLCIKLWTSHEEVTQPLAPVPDVGRVDLSGALLWLSALNINRFDQFMWLDGPSPRLMDFARRSLRWLSAIDAENRITDMGRRLIRYPLEPRWAALLALGEDRGIGGTAAKMAALLSERESARTRTAGPTRVGVSCDVWAGLDDLLDDNRRERSPVARATGQLKALVRPDQGAPTLEEAQAILLLSQGDRLCRRREQRDRALMVGHRGVRLAETSAARGSEFFVALKGVDLPGQADTLVTMASGFDKAFLLKHLGVKVETRDDIYFDESKEQFYGRRGRFIFDLAIDSPALTPVAAEQLGTRLTDELWARWSTVRARNAPLAEWLKRWEFLCAAEPRFRGEVAEPQFRQMLEMAAFGETGFKPVLEKDLSEFLKSVVGRDLAAAVEREVPADFLAPSGVRHKIDYGELHSAFVDVRLQEVFGLAQSPRLAFGKIPITFRLLGPNFRPVQVTADLANFWRHGYHEVRKELRARYPKHSWPEDGLAAKPEAKGRRRG